MRNVILVLSPRFHGSSPEVLLIPSSLSSFKMCRSKTSYCTSKTRLMMKLMRFSTLFRIRNIKLQLSLKLWSSDPNLNLTPQLRFLNLTLQFLNFNLQLWFLRFNLQLWFLEPKLQLLFLNKNLQLWLLNLNLVWFLLRFLPCVVSGSFSLSPLLLTWDKWIELG